MSVQCPVCQRRSANAHCACGFDFATGDRRSVALRARRDRERATRMVKLGFGLFAVMSIGFIIALPLVGVISSLYLLSPMFVAGAATVGQGAVRRRAASRMLARSTEPLPLPAARLRPSN